MPKTGTPMESYQYEIVYEALAQRVAGLNIELEQLRKLMAQLLEWWDEGVFGADEEERAKWRKRKMLAA